MSVPVDLSFRLWIGPGFEGSVTVGWMFGLIHFPIQLNGDKAKEKRARRKRKKARSRSTDRGRRYFLFRSGFWDWLRRLLRKLMGWIRIYRLFLRVRLGLGDPADTGRLWAVAGPVAALLASLPVAEVRLEPNFQEAEFVLQGEGEVRIYPLGLVATLVMTALSPSTWRMFRRAGGVR